METTEQKVARAQELMRQAYAILNTIQPGNIREPNVRSVVAHHENLALLTGHPKPGPLVSAPPLVVLPEPAEEVE